MTREQLEHIVRAAGAISESNELLVIGSQALLASYPGAPSEMMASMEADVSPLDHPERADLIDGSIGELSPFHGTYGYYAHGVGPEAAVLALGWESRLVRLMSPRTGKIAAHCLSPVDLAASKLAAARDKDLEFVSAMLSAHMVDVETLRGTVDQLPSTHIDVARRMLTICISRASA